MKIKFLVVAILGLVFAAIFAAIFVGCKGGANDASCPAFGDVGAVAIPGSVSFDADSGVTTLTGSGANMWGTADEFFMIWNEVTGDFSLSADVEFVGEGVNPHRKMGLIVRTSTEANAVYADVAMHGDGLTSLQHRPAQGADTQEVIGLPSGSELPARIALERRGNTITMKISAAKQGMSDFDKGRADARDFWEGATTGEIVLELPETCLVGLFICSHDASVNETGRFSNIKFEQPKSE